MKIHSINKVLIANRGEIAVRIIRSLQKAGIQSVAIFDDNDCDALFVRKADEAWPLGQGNLSETYLNIEKIIAIAKSAGADAIHPGYGFLSENPAFPEACLQSGLIFIGPTAESMRLMGNKIAARLSAQQHGLPVTKGYTGSVTELLGRSGEMPYPVLVKAAAGGGGKGMRIVRDAAELSSVLETTSREAANYFGDGTVYIEQFIEQPRHIEVQVLGDRYGNLIHLYERECSVQRRYQKIIEESPSPTLSNEVREEMGRAAVKLCGAIGYQSAGTIEFLVDSNLNFYFLEMNTRIQVEHPVTELVTGIDLVEEQIRVACGYPLRYSQSDIQQKGHAIECRIYAEDPENNFMPSPGIIHFYHQPSAYGIRIDSGIDKPSEVKSFFDPMISKLIAYGSDRQQAIQKAVRAIDEYAIHGIHTNLRFLKHLLLHNDFALNTIHTGYCDVYSDKLTNELKDNRTDKETLKAIGSFLYHNLSPIEHTENIWQRIGYWRANSQFDVIVNNQSYRIENTELAATKLSCSCNGIRVTVEKMNSINGKLQLLINGEPITAYVSASNDGSFIVQINSIHYRCLRNDQLNNKIDYSESNQQSDQGSLYSPMPGKVIKINVKAGDRVNRGTVLIVVEAMKMENNIVASGSAIVDKLNVNEGEMVDKSRLLVHLTDIED